MLKVAVRRLLLTVLVFAVAQPARPVFAADRGEPFDQTFWDHWGDGRAELAGYELTMPRYGELRQGVAVAIFVTEPFSDTLRVKADPGRHPSSDTFQVMKLNLVRDFPTGVYDYNLMSSVFVAVQPFDGGAAGRPAKVSFSSQEWCGHVYDQLLFRDRRIDRDSHSYFDGEADQQASLRATRDGVSEDVLFHWARGLAEPFLEAGESRDLEILTSLTTSRLRHRPLEWKKATFARLPGEETVEVPAGTFKVERRRVSVEGGPVWTFFVEKAPPRRIIRWETSEGERGDLLAAERMAYWEMNGGGYQKALQKLGLRPRSSRMP